MAGRACVVGAGFAGLAAADELARAGWDVVVLEARDRVGGRVWSDRLANGAVIERGGEFVTAGYEAMVALCGRLGLELAGMGIRYPDRELSPDPGIDPDALRAGLAAALATASDRPDAPAAPALAAAVADPDVRELFAARLQSAAAYPFDGLRARWFTELPALLAREETRRVAGGNQRLAEALAAALPRPVELDTVVRTIRVGAAAAAGPERVVVATEGSELTADVCVLAVPCWAAGEIAFDPPLPAAAALAAIPVGTAAKLAVALREPPAPRAVMSVPGRWWTWSTTEGDAAGAWAGSRPVVEAVGDAPAWLRGVTALRPELAPDAGDIAHTVWEQAYSVQHTDAEGPYDTGSPHLVLAGEHTAGAWTGTMEGALRSGLRAAAQVRASRGA